MSVKKTSFFLFFCKKCCIVEEKGEGIYERLMKG